MALNQQAPPSNKERIAKVFVKSVIKFFVSKVAIKCSRDIVVAATAIASEKQGTLRGEWVHIVKDAIASLPFGRLMMVTKIIEGLFNRWQSEAIKIPKADFDAELLKKKALRLILVIEVCTIINIVADITQGRLEGSDHGWIGKMIGIAANVAYGAFVGLAMRGLEGAFIGGVLGWLLWEMAEYMKHIPVGYILPNLS